MGERNELGHSDASPVYEQKVSSQRKRSLPGITHKRWKEIPNLGSILSLLMSFITLQSKFLIKIFIPYRAYN